MADVLASFGRGSDKRRLLGRRLERIYGLATRSQHLSRFIIFGSFVTAKEDPGDLDLFLLMDDGFDVRLAPRDCQIIFDHHAAQNHEGASIFWMRRLAILDDENSTVRHWQLKRDGSLRGIVEVIRDD